MQPMTNYPVPDNEQERLAALEASGILDSEPEPSFDRITRLAAQSLDVPIALISLVDRDRQWFKSALGLGVAETPRSASFCAHAICQDAMMVVPDATSDPRFQDNPLVTGDPDIRFYAGAQLRNRQGVALGTLCAIDTRPRDVAARELETLSNLAALVVDLLEMRDFAMRAKTAENRLIDAVEALSDGFVFYDSDDRLVVCNERYREIYAESSDLIRKGQRFEDMLRAGVARGQYPQAMDDPEAWIAERLDAHFNPRGAIEQELPGDQWLRIEERRTRDGGLVGFRVDITQLKRQERKLQELAWTDSLTGLINRRRFLDVAEKEMERARRDQKIASVILIDVDHFKPINDRYGHAAGDHVLKTLAARWTQVVRRYDWLGRLGGEEFAVFLSDADPLTPTKLGERLRLAASQKPILFEGAEISPTVSLGVASALRRDDTVNGLLSRADAALYEAKRAGRNRLIEAAA